VFLNGTNNVTVPIIVYSFASEFTSQWNLIFAGVAISIVPVIVFYIFAQRQLIRGFSGGIRG
jgi:raffinose/stachyose/melibiose transport system permease protein